MDAFRQRKPVAARVVTRSLTVNAVKFDEPKQAAGLAPASKKRAALSTNAAPSKQRRTKPQSIDATEQHPQPIAAATASEQVAGKPRKQRSKKAQPSGQSLTNIAPNRSTTDIESAQPSSAAAETHPADMHTKQPGNSTPDIRAAPSGMPAAIPSGLPPDPAVLHCWTKESMREAAAYLAEKDAALAPLIAQYGVPESLLAKGFRNMFSSLAKSILSQQLAVKAASVIQGRFMELCKCDQVVTPQAVLAVTQEQLRAVGLSNAKARYVMDLASHFHSGQLSDAKIATMDDETLVAELTKVKGIGQWTVDMFAMFHLGRPDIFPLGDLAVRKGLIDLYKLKAKPSVAEFDAIGDVWAPYRSLGSYYMWRLPVHQKPAKRKTAKSTADVSSDVTPSIAAPADAVPSVV